MLELENFNALQEIGIKWDHSDNKHKIFLPTKILWKDTLYEYCDSTLALYRSIFDPEFLIFSLMGDTRHPHVDYAGYFCVGQNNCLLRKLILDDDFFGFIALAMSTVQSYSPRTAFRPIGPAKRCPNCGGYYDIDIFYPCENCGEEMCFYCAESTGTKFCSKCTNAGFCPKCMRYTERVRCRRCGTTICLECASKSRRCKACGEFLYD